MDFIRIDREDAIATITLDRGKANAINRDMAAELLSAVKQVESDTTVRAAVLASAKPKFLSAGFDINEVFLYDRAQLADCFRLFGETYEAMLHMPKGWVAAVPGHCFAAGAILALACDYRVMAKGEFGFALNEINIGITLPEAVFRMTSDIVGNKWARRMILMGEPVPMDQALAIGLADELVEPDAVLARAIEVAKKFAEKPAAPFAEMKLMTRSFAGHVQSSDPGPAVEPWFTPEAEERKKQMMAAMGRK
jgi:enoyl-CoA hydratase/carnithine racemase